MDRRLLALWSVPRARSTAFLRMMAERGDVTVVHEPFARVAAFRAVEIGGRSCRSVSEVIQALRLLTEDGPVFVKDTSDRRHPDILADRDFHRDATHTFLIRSPKSVVTSYLRLDARATREEMGFENILEMYDAVCASTERQPLVIDSDELVSDPVLTVETFCDHVGIPFRPAALRWQPGALEDWSDFSRWHERAAKSTGFVQTFPEPLPVELRGVADEFVAYHLPYYRQLLARAHGPRTG